MTKKKREEREGQKIFDIALMFLAIITCGLGVRGIFQLMNGGEIIQLIGAIIGGSLGLCYHMTYLKAKGKYDE